MPDDQVLTSADSQSEVSPEDTKNHLPPIGDVSKAEKYIDRLIELMNKDKCTVTHSDLSKFGQSSMKEHFRISLGSYDAEVSHSLNPHQKDIYILLFTNTTQIKEGKAKEAILAYINLSSELYKKIRMGVEDYLDRKFREAEQKRFNEAMQPIDDFIDQALKDEQKETPTLIQEEITEPSLEDDLVQETIGLGPKPLADKEEDLNKPFSMFKPDTQPD